MISTEHLEELSSLYLKHYGRVLNDEQVNELATRLIELFKVIAKPVSVIDSYSRKDENGTNA